jgi:hypothetical protein
LLGHRVSQRVDVADASVAASQERPAPFGADPGHDTAAKPAGRVRMERAPGPTLMGGEQRADRAEPVGGEQSLPDQLPQRVLDLDAQAASGRYDFTKEERSTSLETGEDVPGSSFFGKRGIDGSSTGSEEPREVVPDQEADGSRSRWLTRRLHRAWCQAGPHDRA